MTVDTRVNHGDFKFRCSDIHKDCNWEADGNSESELMPKIEQHGREKHNVKNFDENTRSKVRQAIHRQAA